MKVTEKDYIDIAVQEGIGMPELKTIMEVESQGNGHLSDGRPKILFEGHVFYRNLPKEIRERAEKERPDLCHRAWTKAHYRGGLAEWQRLDAAIRYHREAALKACSWGAFQILGENHKQAGFATVQAFVNAMYKPERAHLEAVTRFIKTDRTMLKALQERNWDAFARRYNGPGYAQNQYHIKLAKAYVKHSKNGQLV